MERLETRFVGTNSATGSRGHQGTLRKPRMESRLMKTYSPKGQVMLGTLTQCLGSGPKYTQGCLHFLLWSSQKHGVHHRSCPALTACLLSHPNLREGSKRGGSQAQFMEPVEDRPTTPTPLFNRQTQALRSNTSLCNHHCHHPQLHAQGVPTRLLLLLLPPHPIITPFTLSTSSLFFTVYFGIYSLSVHRELPYHFLTATEFSML